MQSFDETPPGLDLSTHRRANASQREWARWLELALLLGGALGLAFWSVRSGGAPAVIAALLGVLPAIVGLQHGFVASVGGVLVGLLAVWLAPTGAALESVAPMLAPYALALAVGHYSDRARRTRRVLDERVQSQSRQLEQLFRAHSVLRTSHAQLEERLAAREWSLEAAVREAERQVGARDLAGAAGALLELLTTQGRVAGASLYVARDGALPQRADARLGPSPAREEPGRLVRLAFAHGTLVSLERSDAAGEADENVLVALPLCTTGGHVVGVVAVHELPFVAFHDAHFRLLATLIAPFTDALARKVETSEAVARVAKRPSLPPPTRALARLRQTPMLPPAPSAENDLSLVMPGDVEDAEHASDDEHADVSDDEHAPAHEEHAHHEHAHHEHEDDIDPTLTIADDALTVEVELDDAGVIAAVAEVVVVEFDLVFAELERADEHEETTRAYPTAAPASANSNADVPDPEQDEVATVALEETLAVVDAQVPAEDGEGAASDQPARESEVEIVLTQPVAPASNDTDDDDDPTRLHAGPPPGTVIS